MLNTKNAINVGFVNCISLCEIRLKFAPIKSFWRYRFHSQTQCVVRKGLLKLYQFFFSNLQPEIDLIIRPWLVYNHVVR